MFETFSAVILLIIFLVPGFVWRTVEGQVVYLDKRLEWEKFAFGLLTRSTFVYLPFAPLIHRGYRANWIERYPLYTSAAAIGFLIVLPTLWGIIAGSARQKGLGPAIIRKLKMRTFEQHHIPTAWDFLFSKIKPAWVVVTLKNGNKIYGYLSPASYISSDATERDIYISHTLHVLDSGEMEFVSQTQGVYIRPDEVSVIEFTAAE